MPGGGVGVGTTSGVGATSGVGIAICVVGKISSTMIVARLAGENWPFGIAAGILLQTKGLMELVVVTVFRDEKIVSSETYSALVLVALVSTALTMPLSNLFLAVFSDRVDASGKKAVGKPSPRPDEPL